MVKYQQSLAHNIYEHDEFVLTWVESAFELNLKQFITSVFSHQLILQRGSNYLSRSACTRIP